MSQSEILAAIKHLSMAEQFEVIEATLRFVREEMANQLPPTDQDLRAAAAAMRVEYEQDRELTALMALDGEDFHVEG